MELRQLRYFVAVAEELHFGRAAQRQHVVQSALSQQLQLLERSLGVRLLDRDTHHVTLTRAGQALLCDARQILAHVERTRSAVRRAELAAPVLRAGILDACYGSVPLILEELRELHPDLEVHQVEASVPAQYAALTEGRLDIGVGRACFAPAEISSLLFRVDRMGVLIQAGHPLAQLAAIPVRLLADEPLLLPDGHKAPEFAHLVTEMCRSAGFTPKTYPGTVPSVSGAASLIARGRCVSFVPASCAPAPQGTCWRPLREPSSHYPWSLLWRSGDQSAYVRAAVRCARSTARRLGWAPGAPGSPDTTDSLSDTR